MRVMVVEADRGDANRAVQKLEAAGHEVLRCHEQGLGPFPCNGFEHAAAAAGVPGRSPRCGVPCDRSIVMPVSR